MSSSSINIINPGRLFFGEIKHPAFELLRYTKPSLCLDIGAAAGIFTKLMRARSPSSRIFAFEPFPGNHPFFERNIANDPLVTLFKSAVTNSKGRVSFRVPSTVKGDEPGWSSYEGYSSLGHVVGSESTTDTRIVESLALDDLIREHVGFCKIDIQGGEYNALVGSRRLLRDGLIDMLLIEFGGEDAIIELLSDAGYILVDTKYLLVCSRNAPDSSDWSNLIPINLSTGVEAYQAWPVNLPMLSQAYCEWIRSRSRTLGGVWTDLLCVHHSFLPKFLRAAACLIENS